jgi:NADH-ubiquinone/plastoquinone oxidoreductase chain 6.
VIGRGKEETAACNNFDIKVFELNFTFLILGGFIVFFRPSPYFGVLGILIQALKFSIILRLFGFPFFGLLVTLIYVGGLLVVFLFSTILSAERKPEFKPGELFLFGLGGSFLFLSFMNNNIPLRSPPNINSLPSEFELGELFWSFSLISVGAAWFLLVVLMAVLCVRFEHNQLSLRSI